MGKMARAGTGAKIFEKLEPEPHKNRPAPQQGLYVSLVSEATCMEGDFKCVHFLA
jgi:hypothetical protein